MAHKFAISLLLLYASSAIGQTSSDFERQYGKPIVAYQVSETIWMTPEYTVEGQVCLMRLHPRRFSPTTNYVSPRLPFQELKRVLNQLVPAQIRGRKLEPFETGATGGQMEWMTYAYEKLRITFVSPFDIDPLSWKTRREYVFSIGPGTAPAEPAKPQDSTPSDSDFASSQRLNTEIVTIRWNGRQCATQ